MELDIFAAPPAQSRATTQWQYAFVNGRFVRDRFIQHAIREAYRGLVEPSRHGVVFVFISIDPAEVDVNVHPTKVEVRWADSGLIHSQVLSALRETFQRCDLTPRLRTGASPPIVSEEERDRMRREFAASVMDAHPVGRLATAPPVEGRGGGYGQSDHPRFGEPRSSTSTPLGIGEAWRPLYAPPDDPRHAEPSLLSAASSPPPGRFDAAPLGLEALTATADALRSTAVQMHNLYLVAETDEGIIIIDQHALHERVMYEQLRDRITKGPLESQRLLLPESLRVTPAQLGLLDAHADLLARLGIEATPFGADSIAVHTFPSVVRDTDVAAFMGDLLDLLAQQPEHGATLPSPGRPAQPEVVIHKVLDMMACKAAVKAGDVLRPEEIESLMAKRHLLDKPSACPHGRPTMLRLTKADLNRQFKRT